MLLLDPKQIKVIIDLFEKGGVSEIELSKGSEKIKITKSEYRKIVEKDNKWHDTGWGKIIIGLIIGIILLILSFLI